MEADDFENWFRDRIAVARELPNLLFEALHELRPAGFAAVEMPAATVWRFNLAASSQFRAALFCLLDQETTLGSLALLRGLIETWAHLDFILGDFKADANCRALALEVGMRRQRVELLGHAKSPVSGEQIAAAKQNLMAVEELKKQAGCRNKARSYGNVDATVKSISQREGFDWLVDMWRSASETAHMAGWDWLLTVGPDGAPVLTYPGQGHRASRFQHLICLYDNLGRTSLQILTGRPDIEIPDDSVIRRFGGAAADLFNDSDLKVAIDRASD